MIEEFRCGNGKAGMVRYSCLGQLLNRKANPGHPAYMYRPVSCDAPSPSPSPTFPRKIADVDWGSRKINLTKYVRSAGLELPSDPVGCLPKGSAMK